jgi:hypothetical protein
VVPTPGELSTLTLPFDWVTTACTVARPRPVPVPLPLVVKNGSKQCCDRARVHPDAGVRHRKHHGGARPRLLAGESRLYNELPALWHRVAGVEGEVQ